MNKRACLVLALSIANLAIALLSSSIRAQKPPPEANYDESKIAPYTLPAPLTMANGQPVKDSKMWRARRAEILRLFETNVYGRTPKTSHQISFSEGPRDQQALGGIAARKEVTVYLLGRKDGPKMSVLFYIPNDRSKPAPVFLGMNFNGNQAISSDPGITLASSWMRETNENGVINNRATDKTRGSEASRWPIEMIVKRGYAVASIYYGDLFPDHTEGLAESIIPHFFKPGQTAPAADEWNAIGAWAWGLSRAMDYIEKDREFDAKRVAVWGHSRLGKATLWAGAQDERFALVISNDSGEGGAALARRNFGETVARINYSFPHWFCGNFKKYGDDVASLPVDQHMLLALIAPRPLYVASAAEDLWADPRGEFLSAKAASPVYKLLRTDGLAADEMPGIHQPVTSTIGYHIRAGKHDVTNYDWEQYLNFADLRLKRGK